MSEKTVAVILPEAAGIPVINTIVERSLRSSLRIVGPINPGFLCPDSPGRCPFSPVITAPAKGFQSDHPGLTEKKISLNDGLFMVPGNKCTIIILTDWPAGSNPVRSPGVFV
jgi:hypothetical protein